MISLHIESTDPLHLPNLVPHLFQLLVQDGLGHRSHLTSNATQRTTPLNPGPAEDKDTPAHVRFSITFFLILFRLICIISLHLSMMRPNLFADLFATRENSEKRFT